MATHTHKDRSGTMDVSRSASVMMAKQELTVVQRGTFLLIYIGKTFFMPLPFKEWWKRHIVLPLTISSSPSASGISDLHLSFSDGASMSFGHIFSLFGVVFK